MSGTNHCAMSEDCADKKADRGLMCEDHRRESDEIERRFSDDVDPASREPVEVRRG